MRSFNLLHVAPLVGIAFAAPATSYNCSTAVKTTNGNIIGHAAANKTSVCEYLGIPFAQPPVGAMRFNAPLPYNGSGTYIAAEFGADCPQSTGEPYNFPNKTAQEPMIVTAFADRDSGNPQSEDCLTLNIWSKQGSGSASKPVLVWFYGGRYSLGTSHTQFYDGQYFANNEDAVVVTLNYRLTIFGFPGAPNLTQNVGWLDQRRAVEWVYNNIASFGGDPERITIDGQSAGSVAVDNWAYAFKEDPIVAGLISNSGNVLSFPINSAELAASNWYNVSGQLGCGTTGDTVDCMRTKSISSLLDAVAIVPAPPGSSVARSQPAFQATVDNITVFADYATLANNGDFAPIPYLQGMNNHESGYYRLPPYAEEGVLYAESVWTEFEIEDFTCPTAFAGYNRIRHGVPSWRFRYFGEWDNLRLYTNSSTTPPSTSGAYHGSDVSMIIGNTLGISGIPPSAEEDAVSAYMQGAWSAFIQSPSAGLTAYGWPLYDQSKPTLVRLGYNNSPVPNFVLPSTYDSACPALNLSYYSSSIL